MISRVATSEISILQLVPVPEQACLNLTLSETPKTGFYATRPKYNKPGFLKMWLNPADIFYPENVCLLHLLHILN